MRTESNIPHLPSDDVAAGTMEEFLGTVATAAMRPDQQALVADIWAACRLDDRLASSLGHDRAVTRRPLLHACRRVLVQSPLEAEGPIQESLQPALVIEMLGGAFGSRGESQPMLRAGELADRLWRHAREFENRHRAILLAALYHAADLAAPVRDGQAAIVIGAGTKVTVERLVNGRLEPDRLLRDKVARLREIERDRPLAIVRMDDERDVLPVDVLQRVPTTPSLQLVLALLEYADHRWAPVGHTPGTTPPTEHSPVGEQHGRTEPVRDWRAVLPGMPRPGDLDVSSYDFAEGLGVSISGREVHADVGWVEVRVPGVVTITRHLAFEQYVDLVGRMPRLVNAADAERATFEEWLLAQYPPGAREVATVPGVTPAARLLVLPNGRGLVETPATAQNTRHLTPDAPAQDPADTKPDALAAPLDLAPEVARRIGAGAQTSLLPLQAAVRSFAEFYVKRRGEPGVQITLGGVPNTALANAALHEVEAAVAAACGLPS